LNQIEVYQVEEQEIEAMKKERPPFNPAFEELHQKMKKAQKAPREPDVRGSLQDQHEPDDRAFFIEAMSDVTPLPGAQGKIMKSPGPNTTPAHPAPDDMQEAMAYLQDLVKGSKELDITFSDEYVEGSVKGFSRKLMNGLKKGQFPVQDYIDLHGLTKQEAESKVRDFLIQSYRLGLRCVLIVHGRGLNSPESFPVLKERLPVWLGRGFVRKIVLAFATAKPYDGGTGAMYVLLRKR
jgi:DNA-nicking Smr family endonuclease